MEGADLVHVALSNSSAFCGFCGTFMQISDMSSGYLYINSTTGFLQVDSLDISAFIKSSYSPSHLCILFFLIYVVLVFHHLLLYQ